MWRKSVVGTTKMNKTQRNSLLPHGSSEGNRCAPHTMTIPSRDWRVGYAQSLPVIREGFIEEVV